VLQEREALPVGAIEPIPGAARIIAATNRDLEEEVRRGNFRSDLFYRLNVITLNLPPLRDRRDDILLLLESTLQHLASDSGAEPKALASEALDAVMVYDWPGNVRELENALEHAVVLTRGNLIEAGTLPERITRRRKEPLVAERSYLNPTLDVIERAYIMWVLQAEGGNKTRAAEVLGIDPSTLYRKLSRYEEQVESKAESLPPRLFSYPPARARCRLALRSLACSVFRRPSPLQNPSVEPLRGLACRVCNQSVNDLQLWR
jgi:DNA-binding NtrC family response regulator